MSYVVDDNSARRLPAMIAVGGIHAGIGLVLVTGLTYSGVIPEVPGYDPVREFRLDPPPPPETSPEPDQAKPDVTPNQPMVAPTPELPLIVEMPISPAPFDPDLPFIDTIPLSGRGPLAPPAPPTPPAPFPAFTPKGAVPLNGPAGWITNDEYPRAALTRGWEGTLSYRLAIGADGKVDDCRVTRSSGHDLLDQTACRWVSRRARFDPATDAHGRKIGADYSGSVSWRIPD